MSAGLSQIQDGKSDIDAAIKLLTGTLNALQRVGLTAAAEEIGDAIGILEIAMDKVEEGLRYDLEKTLSDARESEKSVLAFINAFGKDSQ